MFFFCFFFWFVVAAAFTLLLFAFWELRLTVFVVCIFIIFCCCRSWSWYFRRSTATTEFLEIPPSLLQQLLHTLPLLPMLLFIHIYVSVYVVCRLIYRFGVRSPHSHAYVYMYVLMWQLLLRLPLALVTAVGSCLTLVFRLHAPTTIATNTQFYIYMRSSACYFISCGSVVGWMYVRLCVGEFALVKFHFQLAHYANTHMHTNKVLLCVSCFTTLLCLLLL